VNPSLSLVSRFHDIYVIYEFCGRVCNPIFLLATLHQRLITRGQWTPKGSMVGVLGSAMIPKVLYPFKPILQLFRCPPLEFIDISGFREGFWLLWVDGTKKVENPWSTSFTNVTPLNIDFYPILWLCPQCQCFKMRNDLKVFQKWSRKDKQWTIEIKSRSESKFASMMMIRHFFALKLNFFADV